MANRRIGRDRCLKVGRLVESPAREAILGSPIQVDLCEASAPVGTADLIFKSENVIKITKLRVTEGK